VAPLPEFPSLLSLLWDPIGELGAKEGAKKVLEGICDLQDAHLPEFGHPGPALLHALSLSGAVGT